MELMDYSPSARISEKKRWNEEESGMIDETLIILR
jgi:hypothetical protein